MEENFYFGATRCRYMFVVIQHCKRPNMPTGGRVRARHVATRGASPLERGKGSVARGGAK